jgi:hypothetical protein
MGDLNFRTWRGRLNTVENSIGADAVVAFEPMSLSGQDHKALGTEVTVPRGQNPKPAEPAVEPHVRFARESYRSW